MPIVYVFSVLLGFVNVIDNPARQTFVHGDGRTRRAANAVGLNSVVMNSSRIVGPAVGGMLIELVGIAPCFFINAASYVAVIVALAMMDASKLQPVPTVARARRASCAKGFRYVWSEPPVRIPLLMMAVIGTLAFNFQVVIPLIATEDVRHSARAGSACCSR